MTCHYHTPSQPACPAPATHRVLGMHDPVRWSVFLALEENNEVGEFCLRHAGDVMTQRNRKQGGRA